MVDSSLHSAVAHAALEALPQHVALLDERGRVLFVNRSWRASVPPPGSRGLVGAHFADLVPEVEGGSVRRREEALAGIESVLGGRASGFSLEWPVGSGPDGAWFILQASPCAGGAVLTRTEVSALVRQRDEIRQLALRDPLTGLANRLGFRERSEQLLESARRHRRRLRLLYMDLDGFKRINDDYGHSAGDSVLRAVASRLRASTRASDLLARWGGDEFVALVEVAPGSDAEAPAQRYRDCLERPIRADGRRLRASLSIGVADYPEGGEELDDLLLSADRSMYCAKRSRRARGELHASR